MRKLALAAALVSPVVFIPVIAGAQDVGVYVGPGYETYSAPGYFEESTPEAYRPHRGVRVYGYTRWADDDDRFVERRRSGGCGTYYYWDGEECVDARGDR